MLSRLASSHLAARARVPNTACFYVSLMARGRQSLCKPPAAITATFSVGQQLQWGCRGFASGKQGNTSFEKVILKLLESYYQREGHCDVPGGYTVTAKDLAAADLTRSDCKIGFRLGRSLQYIQLKGTFDMDTRPDRQAALDAINCDWTGERRFQRIITALQWFEATEGHMEVPKELVLDKAQCNEAGLPHHITKFRLGVTVDNIRGGHLVQTTDLRRKVRYDARRSQLDSIGFIWDHDQHRFDHHVMPALHWFKATEGHMDVPLKLVMDKQQCSEAGLPTHITEFRLGETVDNIRTRGDFVQAPDQNHEYAAHKAQASNHPGGTNFIWDFHQHRFDSYVKPALRWFKASEGHTEVPIQFVLDEAQCQEAGLPQHVTEFCLGHTVSAIRHEGICVHTEDPSREAQCETNKDWLEARDIRFESGGDTA